MLNEPENPSFNRTLYSELVSASRRRGGSFDTKQRRERECRRFCIWLQRENRQYRRAAGIKVRDVRRYFAELLELGLDPGALQNRASYLRAVLPKFVISNRRLGIGSRSREGTHIPCPQVVYKCALHSIRDDWAKALLMLQRHLGLRILEAVRSGVSLRSWKKQLTEGDTIRVVFGTKGGRPRLTQVCDRVKALEAVTFSLEVLRSERRKTLVPSRNQRSAKDLYYSRLRKVGLKGDLSSHSLRYRFACELLEKYAREGFSEKEAFSLVAQSLGHGDGRGKYVRSVYCRLMPAFHEIQRRHAEERFRRALTERHKIQYINQLAGMFSLTSDAQAFPGVRKIGIALVDQRLN